MKTNLQLAEYAKAQVGRPYWWGTYGQTATEALHIAKKKQYPSQYKANDFKNQYGQRVHDCSGLIKGYLMSDNFNSYPKYMSQFDLSADGYLKKATIKGDISTIPEIIGVLVHYTGHIGVYVGNDIVIEARGHNYGVVRSNLSRGKWKNWSVCPFITYVESPKATAPVEVDATPDDIKEVQIYLNNKLGKATLGTLLETDGKAGKLTHRALIMYFQKLTGIKADGDFGAISLATASRNNREYGDKDEIVKLIQMALICKGYSLAPYGADGSWGGLTDKVMEQFQKAKALKADKIAGSKTIKKLLTL